MKKFEIDNFIKDKLTHLQPEFDEQAWDDLEKKLDNEDNDRKAILWWWNWDKIAAIFVVGFFGYLAYYLHTNQAVETTPLYVKNNIKTQEKTENKPQTFSEQKEQENTSYTYQEPQKLFKNTIKKRVIVPIPKKQPQEVQALAMSFDRELEGKMLQNHFTENIRPVKVFTIDSNLITYQNNQKKNKHKRQSFGVALSPVISPQGLQAGLGYTHEVAISEKVKVLSGISYTPWSATTQAVASSMVNPSSLNPDVKVKLNTLEIPIEAKVKVAKNIAVSGGVSNTLLLKETIGNVVNNSPELSISSINLGVSYDIKISKNSQINLQPYYRIPIQSVGLSGTQLSGFGLRTGFSYNTR